MDDQQYLEPGFDPSSLTIPRLRSILVAHNVNYPSSAKKQQLVDIFNEQVLPQATKLRSANARVKRTSKGIVNAASGQSKSEDQEDEEETLASAPSTARSSRRRTRASTEEAQEPEPTPRGFRHSTAPPEATPRRASSKHARPAEPVDSEPEVKPATKKARPTATPVVKKHADDDSPFSSDNVFQTGSSPPRPSSHEPERRRTTTSAASDAERRRSREPRRKTDDVLRPARPQLDGAVVPTRSTFEMPVSALKKPRQEVQLTQEFTPEEQQELVQAGQSLELVPAGRRARRQGATAAPVALWTVLAAMLTGVLFVARQEKLEVGYCGVGRPTTDVAGVHVPDWADFLRPECEPCPPHAFCDKQLQTQCEAGFVLTPHPLSLGGLVPLPPSCVPDSMKARKVNAVVERVVEELRDQNAKYECGEADRPEVKESELKFAISTKKRKGMTNEEFEDLWESAVGEIKGVDEVISGTDGSGFTLRSTSLARLPLGCAIRRSLRETLRRYFWQAVALLLVALSGTYGYYAITTGHETERKAKDLAGLALEKLSLQASLHAQDPDTWRENYISMAQLRDDVLRDEFSASRRKKLWEKVQRKVESNANVRPMVREGRSGDVGRVWEWVGAIGMLESPPGSAQTAGGGGYRRRTNNRVSFGGVTSERLIEANDESVGKVGKWEEGRPYY